MESQQYSGMELASTSEVETEVANKQSESPVDQSTILSGGDINITWPDLPPTGSLNPVEYLSNQHGAYLKDVTFG